MSELEALRLFFREGMDAAFNGCDWCGGDIQDRAVELGLAKYEPYDPDRHGEVDFLESGEDICVIVDTASEGQN